MTRDALRVLFAILAVVVTTSMMGCSRTHRSPSDPPLPPPLDMAAINWEQQARRVLSLESQMPAREAYVIGPGDVLSLQLIGRPDLLGLVDTDREGFVIEVTDSPTITIPYIGAIAVHGKTVEEIEESIREAYRGMVRDPAPVLTVKRYNDNMYSVVGSVVTPGRYPLEVGTTVLEGIFQAGGLTFGGRSGNMPPARTMKIYRNKLTKQERFTLSPDEMLDRLSVDGTVLTRREIVLPLDDFLLGGDLRWNIPIQPNDIIFIPPAGTVTVIGDVAQPRVVFLGPGLRTVAQVINEAGNTRFGARSTIEVVRTNPNGSTESYFLHSRQIRRRQAQDFFLQDNDQVFVYRSSSRSVLEWFGNFFQGSARTGLNATYSPM